MSGEISFLARLYRVLFHYRDLYESRMEAIVVPCELALIGFGLWLTFHRLGEGREMAVESGEALVFVLLLLLLVSRYAVRVRGSRLGYAYERIMRKLAASQEDAAFQKFQDEIVRMPLGWSPGHVDGMGQAGESWRERAHVYAAKIAAETARLLSVRSWLFLDSRWQERERDSLGEWFRQFPAALWLLPEDDHWSPQDPAAAGGYYCSVIVPMTRASGRSIRKGQRATDLAELDTDVTRRVDSGAAPDPAPPAALAADLLAYVHIHVPKGGMRSTRAEMRLLAASVQHLGLFLYTMFGAGNAATSRWNFSILCESSNRHMSAILRRLGFTRLHREEDGSETQRQEARSYGGFALFEFRARDGQGEDANAGDFLVLLEKVVRLHAQRDAGRGGLQTAADAQLAIVEDG